MKLARTLIVTLSLISVVACNQDQVVGQTTSVSGNMTLVEVVSNPNLESGVYVPTSESVFSLHGLIQHRLIFKLDDQVVKDASFVQSEKVGNQDLVTVDAGCYQLEWSASSTVQNYVFEETAAGQICVGVGEYVRFEPKSSVVDEKSLPLGPEKTPSNWLYYEASYSGSWYIPLTAGTQNVDLGTFTVSYLSGNYDGFRHSIVNLVHSNSVSVSDCTGHSAFHWDPSLAFPAHIARSYGADANGTWSEISEEGIPFISGAVTTATLRYTCNVVAEGSGDEFLKVHRLLLSPKEGAPMYFYPELQDTISSSY